MIRAAFFDVDGTLIGRGRPGVVESAARALSRLKEKKIRLYLATGRHWQDLDVLGSCRELFDGFLTMNGGYCRLADGTVFFRNPLDPGDIAAAVEYLLRTPLPVMFREEERRYFSCLNETVRRIGAGIPRQGRVEDIRQALGREVFQLCPYGNEAEIAGLMAVMPHCQSVRWNEFGVDVVPKEGGKDAGIRAALALTGVRPEEAAAFGDGENDESMLRFAGIGVAMGNAPERVKRAADYVAPPVDEDGLAQALCGLGLLEEKDIF
ncbi:MAG: HAD hydrolase family protein [Oscillospiraceae bacterium]|nr:HAD hydrolase family protein [Oscillospiraceae bacterium]